MILQEFSQEFDKHLFLFLKNKLRTYTKLARDPELGVVISHIEPYMKGGKRLRPYGAYIGLRERKKSLTKDDWMVMISLELIHVLALIHDDIIDKATDRRGVPSINQYVFETSNLVRGDKTHYANSQALLIGDLVFAAAFQALRESKTSPVIQEKIHQLLDEVIIGQMIDVKLAYSSTASKNLITRKSKYKTALYTFARPLEIGAVLASVSPEKQQELYRIGEALGVTYQIQDDLLDVFGNSDVLKKEIMNDIREGQQTLLTDYFWKSANDTQKKEFSRFFGCSFTKKDIPFIQNLLRDAGVEVYLKKELARNFTKTKKMIDASSLSKDTKQRLHILVNVLEVRST